MGILFQTKSCSSLVFNSKLDSLIILLSECVTYIQPLLEMTTQPGNTNRSGRLIAVGLFIKVACFVKKNVNTYF